MFRFACGVMFILLVACIAVQYNDPDGFVWMLVYGYGLVVTVFAFRGKETLFSVAGFLSYLGGFFYFMPSTWDGWYENEQAREALGLLFAALCMLVLTAHYFRTLQRRAVAAREVAAQEAEAGDAARDDEAS